MTVLYSWVLSQPLLLLVMPLVLLLLPIVSVLPQPKTDGKNRQMLSVFLLSNIVGKKTP